MLVQRCCNSGAFMGQCWCIATKLIVHCWCNSNAMLAECCRNAGAFLGHFWGNVGVLLLNCLYNTVLVQYLYNTYLYEYTCEMILGGPNRALVRMLELCSTFFIFSPICHLSRVPAYSWLTMG